MLAETVIILIITSSVGVITAVVHLLYKSKCTKVVCCCCEIDRDVEIEEELDEIEIKRDRHNKK